MKTHSPKVAVLLAAYNGKEWIEEQINSILNQEKVNVTIYISIDLSSDDTYGLVKELASDFDNIIVLPYGMRYGGAAANFFRLIREVRFAVYDYVALSDQDDIWDLNKLSRASELLTSDGYDAYSSNCTAFWDNGIEKFIDKAQPQVEFDYLFESAGPGCTFVFSKKFAMELQKKLRGIKEEASEIWLHDWFAYSFARSNDYRWVIDKNTSMSYRQHAHNQVGSNTGLNAILNRAIVMLSGEGFRKVLSQAEVLSQEELIPIKLLKNNSRLSFLKLAFLFRSCRRKPLEQIFFVLVCLLMAVKGPVTYE